MGGASSTPEKSIQFFFLLENVKGRDHSENLSIDGSITSEGILGK
jgi:hypothetical protein